jgi:Raf kinase inhibitor-like YbhB/YbcL family protein
LVAATSTTASTTVALSLQAPWPDRGPIDIRFTCDGGDRSPSLTWTAPPAGTVELVLLVTDDDADDFVHWAVAAIPPTAGEVGEGAQITGATEGRNDFGNPGWGGPCPPSGTHTYRFALYALGQQAELPDEFGGGDLKALADSTSIAVAETTGTYTRQ